jgi:multisubunit Na+/H+ antiporter MnhB subunit
MERIFQILAVILAGIAAYFLWTGNGDGAFVAGVLGAVSFFLSVRFQVKERNNQREAEENFETYELEEKMRFEDELETEEFQENKLER